MKSLLNILNNVRNEGVAVARGTADFFKDGVKETILWLIEVLRENIDLALNYTRKQESKEDRKYLSSKLLEANWFLKLVKSKQGRETEEHSILRPQTFHNYHILDPSPWPFLTSFGAATMMIGFVIYVHMEGEEFLPDSTFLWAGLVQLLLCSGLWWNDVVFESEEEHTEEVRKGLKIGMMLFIVSEVMFFFSFFWAFFHLSLSPSIEMGSIWPPIELDAFLVNPYKIPLANTVILLSSGVTITYAHHQLNWLSMWAKSSLFLIKLRLFLVRIKEEVFSNRNQQSKRAAKIQEQCESFFTSIKEIEKSKIINSLLLRFLASEKKWSVILSSGKEFKQTLMELRKARISRREFAAEWHNILSKSKASVYFNEQFAALDAFSAMKKDYTNFLSYTLYLAIAFTFFQFSEYTTCEINLSDGAFGSTFYLLTGFHGFHVLIGSIFIFVCLARAKNGDFEDGKYIGLECAIWYWHFVDVVWLFLYIFVYIWSSTTRVVGINTELRTQQLENFYTQNREIFEQEEVSASDFASTGQLSFQDPASFVMENIISLHNYVMVFLILIFGVVIWFFFTILNKFIQQPSVLDEEIDAKVVNKGWRETLKSQRNYFTALKANELEDSDDLIGLVDYKQTNSNSPKVGANKTDKKK